MANKLQRKLASRKQRIQFWWRRLKYAHHALPKEFDWDWSTPQCNRVAVVNALVGSQGQDCQYLEIGCDKDSLFNAVGCADKVGVDPSRGGTLRLTSDEFFASNEDKFDVIFVDGLHEYKQVRRDAINAAACLRPGGWMAFHDFLPRTWREQHVPRLNRRWTGDCWKLAVELAASPDFDFRILKVDHGIGVVRPNTENPQLVDMRDSLLDAQLDTFVNQLESLPVCEWQDGIRWINGA